MSDEETLAVYGQQAEKYAALVEKDTGSPALKQFAESLPQGAKVLDWGCGAGNSAGAFKDLGFNVTATDASPEFAALVEKTYGIPVRVETFEALTEKRVYDGVWASFSLLHAPKADIAKHLAAAHQATKPGGKLYLGMKLGEGEARDTIGRFYAYYTEPELEGLLANAGFTITNRRHGSEEGLDGKMWPYILIYADA